VILKSKGPNFMSQNHLSWMVDQKWLWPAVRKKRWPTNMFTGYMSGH